MRCRVRKAVPRLAKDLGADDEAIRRVAYESLQGFFTRRLPEFDPAASPEVRARQRREVRDWLKKKN